MAKKGKAKARLDKYYHIAKEQGYRSRAAFKLIQLNRKYNFLSSATCVIDLCAAPGGWLQVASKFMPQNSVKIGVDLDPIKAIPGVITMQEDITTAKCVARIRKHLKTMKADAVLNDGAPNVGGNWSHDAYNQNELVLMALKLATEFLKKGGLFVTKIFRSTDYNSLMWVLGKFFEKVEATKPQASRYASAEIFVVGLRYLAPESIDPKLFDPKYIFQDTEGDYLKEMLSTDIHSLDKVIEKKRNRAGYADNAPVGLHRTITFSEFVTASNPYPILIEFNQIVMTPECKAKYIDGEPAIKPPADWENIVSDLRVQGKRELGALIKWRGKLLHKAKNLAKKDKTKKPASTAMEEEDGEDAELSFEGEEAEGSDAELDEKVAAASKRELNELRKERDKKLSAIIKRGNILALPAEHFQDDNEVNLEALHDVKNLEDLDYYDSEEERLAREEEEAELEAAQRYKGYQIEKVTRESVRTMEENLEMNYEAKKRTLEKNRTRQEEAEAKRKKSMEEDEEEKMQSNVENRLSARVKPNEMIEELASKEYLQLSKWYQKTAFDQMKQHEGIDMGAAKTHNMVPDDDDEDGVPVGGFINPLKLSNGMRSSSTASFGRAGKAMRDDEMPMFENEDELAEKYQLTKIPTAKEKRKKEMERNRSKKERRQARKKKNLDSEEEVDDGTGTGKLLNTKIEFVPADYQQEDSAPRKQLDDYDMDTLAETLALAKKMIRKKDREEIIESTYNRGAMDMFEGAPSWFLEDELQHCFKIAPITKEEFQAEKERLYQIQNKPIRKIAEAKFRRRKRVMGKMKKAQQKAESIMAQDGLTEQTKAKEITKIYKKEARAGKREKKYIVAKRGEQNQARGANKGGGKTSRFVKMVDRRMKKDKRAQKRALQRGPNSIKRVKSKTRQARRRK